MNTSFAFSRRGPDRVTEELAAVLSTSAPIEFKSLFTIVYANLKLRKAASGGEEMLRLRAYEKLQALVQAGLVKKLGKEYAGVAKALAPLLESAAAAEADPAAAAAPEVQSKQRVHLAKAISPKRRRAAGTTVAAS